MLGVTVGSLGAVGAVLGVVFVAVREVLGATVKTVLVTV